LDISFSNRFLGYKKYILNVIDITINGCSQKFVLTLNVLSEPKAKCMLRIGLQNCIPELEGKINICLKDMDVNLVQSIAGSVQKRLNTVHRKASDAL